MNRKLKLIAIAAVAVIGAATWMFGRGETASASGDDLTSPRTLYVQNCARCHGSDGKAETALGKKLDAKDITGHLSTAKIIRTVTNGRENMPSFKKKLTPAQIKAIAGYVHSSL